MRVVLLLLSLFCVCIPLSAQIKSFRANDALKASAPLKCVEAEEVEVTSTAADVVAGAKDCLKKKRYEEAAALVLVASAFVDYDTRRVVDKTAHAARQAIFADAFAGLSEERMVALFAEIEALALASPRHQAICDHLESLDPPRYFPTYMIAHGMGVFTEDSEPALVEPFDAETAWHTTLEEFTQCDRQ